MEKNEVVLDAGPLIHLGELGALDSLRGFSTLYLPSQVIGEVNKHQPDALTVSDLKFTVREIASFPPELIALGQALLLDQGELEALSILQTVPEAIFLTDDAAARLAAEEMGFQAYGTIGLLIRTVRMGFRKPDEVINLIEQIPLKSSLHIKKSLLDHVLLRLNKEWDVNNTK